MPAMAALLTCSQRAALTGSQRQALLAAKSQETKERLGLGMPSRARELDEAEVDQALAEEMLLEQEAWERHEREEAAILYVHKQLPCSSFFWN